MKTLPALFAPLLFDSPCISTERENFGDQNETLKVCMLDKFSVEVFNKVVDKYLSPLVDSCDHNPGFSSQEISTILVNMIKIHTDYRHLIENKIFQPMSLVQLMFGNFTSGLRQLAVRQILVSALFKKPLENLASTLETLKGSVVPVVGSPYRKLKVSKSNHDKEWQDIEVPDTFEVDSALNVSSLSDTVAQGDHNGVMSQNNLTLSEPDIRSSTPVQDDSSNIHRFGENWYLRESPQYHHGQQRRVFNSLDGYELEISQDSGRQTVSRLNRMLQETDDRLERLQSEVHQVSHREPSQDEEDDRSVYVYVPQKL